jgi:hypothetical protein
MKKTTASYALLLSVALIFGSHLETQIIDGKRIFMVDSVYFDLTGLVEEKKIDWLNLILSRCDSIETLKPQDPDYQDSWKAIQLFSPPDSNSAMITQIARDGEWIWAEVKFQQLEPVVVLLKRDHEGLKISDGAIWSGPTYPWRVKNSIERYLKTKAPPSSHRILECMAPSAGVFFKD